jgi:hypothetical protein
MAYRPTTSSAAQRARLREQGYLDGRAGRARASEDPEYRTSYRRGKEAANRERPGRPGRSGTSP